jgi:hypothetical protein
VLFRDVQVLIYDAIVSLIIVKIMDIFIGLVEREGSTAPIPAQTSSEWPWCMTNMSPPRPIARRPPLCLISVFSPTGAEAGSTCRPGGGSRELDRCQSFFKTIESVNGECRHENEIPEYWASYCNDNHRNASAQ